MEAQKTKEKSRTRATKKAEWKSAFKPGSHERHKHKQRKQSMTSPQGLAKTKQREVFFVSPFVLLFAYVWTMILCLWRSLWRRLDFIPLFYCPYAYAVGYINYSLCYRVNQALRYHIYRKIVLTRNNIYDRLQTNTLYDLINQISYHGEVKLALPYDTLIPV